MSAKARSSVSLPNRGFKKKLYKFRLRAKEQKQEVQTHFTKQRQRAVRVNSVSIEHDVRGMLARKITGTFMGLWFLVAEHLRLRTWNLLEAWAGTSNPNALEPRLALQMVHESALCVNGIREQRTLRHKGFEVLNGLPFVAADTTIHHLLDAHTMAESQVLQIALGKIRRARGHYRGRLILVDPHRIISWSQSLMQPKKATPKAPAKKNMQTFFAIDGDSGQPFGFGMGSASVTVTQATPVLVDSVENILAGGQPTDEILLAADAEHFTIELLKIWARHPFLKILIPAPRNQKLLKQIEALEYTRLRAGYAVAEGEYVLDRNLSIRLLAQRVGEREDDFDYKSFVTTSTFSPEELMAKIFPERWNIEEFFNIEGALGWNRAGTINHHIRYGRLTMALIAQAAIHQFRQKLPGNMKNWTVENIGRQIFGSIDGNIRVKQDTIIVTCNNAPEAGNFKEHYENLPQKLEAEGIDPQIPWLYNFKLDFRFR